MGEERRVVCLVPSLTISANESDILSMHYLSLFPFLSLSFLVSLLPPFYSVLTHTLTHTEKNYQAEGLSRLFEEVDACEGMRRAFCARPQ